VNKLLIVGIIIAAVIVVGTFSMYYIDNNTKEETLPEEIPTSGGRHFSVELKEAVGVSERP